MPPIESATVTADHQSRHRLRNGGSAPLRAVSTHIAHQPTPRCAFTDDSPCDTEVSEFPPNRARSAATATEIERHARLF